ncbi:MAG: hypothetical protein WC498_01230 [Candidatus Saccharimonadales bacterium]
MIWSSKAHDLRSNSERIRTARMFQTTENMRPVFEDRNIPFAPVDYFEIPAGAHAIGKLVIPYVSLDGRGKLVDSLPSFYGVTKRPDTHGFESDNVTRVMQQRHVTAEDLSLRRGIFTPYGRVSAELFVAQSMAEVLQEGYVSDRIIHLEELTKEAGTSEQLYEKQRAIVVEELGVAIDALRDII